MNCELVIYIDSFELIFQWSCFAQRCIKEAVSLATGVRDILTSCQSAFIQLRMHTCLWNCSWPPSGPKEKLFRVFFLGSRLAARPVIKLEETTETTKGRREGDRLGQEGGQIKSD